MAVSTTLSVNINAVAMLRNRRDLPWPSLTNIGLLALEAGASGLTVHPRPDQRHVRFSDLPELRGLTTDRAAEFNVEGYPSPEFIELVLEHRPDQVTLVPDEPSQNTSDHGWDFVSNFNFLTKVVDTLHKHIDRVSLFADPDADETQVAAAKASGADRIELYTGPYGATYDNAMAAQEELDKLSRTAAMANQYELGVNAGHDLTVFNLPPLVSAIPNLLEVSIGHALIADALEFGIAETVRRFQKAIN